MNSLFHCVWSVDVTCVFRWTGFLNYRRFLVFSKTFSQVWCFPELLLEIYEALQHPIVFEPVGFSIYLKSVSKYISLPFLSIHDFHLFETEPKFAIMEGCRAPKLPRHYTPLKLISVNSLK